MQGNIGACELKQSQRGNSYSRVQINGQWFSAFDMGQLARFGVGAMVTYESQQQGQYTNIVSWQCNGQSWVAQPRQGGGGGGGGAPRPGGGGASAVATKSNTELLLNFSAPILAAFIGVGGDCDSLPAIARLCRQAAAELKVTRPAPAPVPQQAPPPPPPQQPSYQQQAPAAGMPPYDDDDIPF